jgi:RecB family endonuclease NucS
MKFVEAHAAQGDRLAVVRPDGSVAMAEQVARMQPSFSDDPGRDISRPWRQT